MPLSMDPSVHYVTQSSCFGTAYLGRLTNRRIAFYQKRGYYGPAGVLAESKAKAKRKPKGKTKRQTTLEELRKLYVF